jgi:hypothetical protein
MAGLASQRSVKTIVGLQVRSDPTILYAAVLVTTWSAEWWAAPR